MTSKDNLLYYASRIDYLHRVLKEYLINLSKDDPNHNVIKEARDFLEAAAGKLRCAL